MLVCKSEHSVLERVDLLEKRTSINSVNAKNDRQLTRKLSTLNWRTIQVSVGKSDMRKVLKCQMG